MKKICITGASRPSLDRVSGILHRSGLAQPRPALRGDAVDLDFWHDRVLTQALDEAGCEQPIASPGRLWEQLAGDIFFANIDVAAWGWADSRSTWLLDFWLAFDPGIQFLLVCSTPEQMLAETIVSADADLGVEAVIDEWQARHLELLRFHHRNPQRSLLVDARACVLNPEALVERCAARWKVPLELPPIDEADDPEQDRLAAYLAQQLCQDFPQTASLQNELIATIAPLADPEIRPGMPAQEPEALKPESLIDAYRALHRRAAEREQALLERDRLVTLGEALADDLATLSVVQEQQARRLEDEESRIQALSHERAEQERQIAQQQALLEELSSALELARNKDSEARQESELLLLQLHQVQEELEAIFLKQAATQEEVARIAKARDEQANLAAERQSQIEALNKAREAQAKPATDPKGQIDALTKARDEQAKLAAEARSQADTLTKARDEQARLAAERQNQVDTLTKARDEQARLATERQNQIDALTKARDEQARLAAERQSKIDALTAEQSQHASRLSENRAQIDNLSKAVDAAQAQRKESEQESELLLLQLHQVQEELEHYFLKHKEAESQVAAADARWQRMLERNPDFCDYESIEILPGKDDQHAAIAWRLKGLNAVGRALPELGFETVVEQGIAGFVLTREADTSGPLVRWPSSAAQENEIALIPIGSKANIAQRIQTLFDLATRDWDLVQALVRLLNKALENPQVLAIPQGAPVDALRSGLAKLAQIVAKFPPTFRYDAVSLKREQVNPDYEHLWLRFENPGFGRGRWPHFEFRLSCANVRPGVFGNYPKLEFPEESSQAPFEAWFIEAYDDFGAKLELRFAVPESMDLEVWQRVSERDRAFLNAIVQRLPSILQTLQASGVQLKRPWDDWVKMAQLMQRIVAVRTAPPPATVAEEPAPVPDAAETHEPVETQPAATDPEPVEAATAPEIAPDKAASTKRRKTAQQTFVVSEAGGSGLAREIGASKVPSRASPRPQNIPEHRGDGRPAAPRKPATRQRAKPVQAPGAARKPKSK